MNVILTTVVVFVLVIIVLVGILLFAKAKLLPSGKVKININNGERTIEVDGGSSLLATLGSNGIFLPSAIKNNPNALIKASGYASKSLNYLVQLQSNQPGIKQVA